MTAEPPARFLMTPAQHREWARLARKRSRPDQADRHEQLARVIEKLAKQPAEAPTVTSPPIAPAT